MDITYLGRSCFKIKGKQATIITDPYGPDFGLMGKQSANIVTVSHDHADHNYTQAVDNVTKVISRCGEYEVSGVLINGIPSFHDGMEGAERGKNIIFVYTIDEITICHLGDLGHIVTSSVFDEIDNIDILMIPVGGKYTINSKQASTITRHIEPKIVIPMHYNRDLYSADLEPVDNFFKEMGSNKHDPLAKLTVTKQSLPLTPTISLLDVSK